MALYHYRRGDWEEVLKWAHRSSLHADEVGSRMASLRCLTAVAAKELGREEDGRFDFEAVAAMIPAPPQLANDRIVAPSGLWLSWSVARILLREAREAFSDDGDWERSAGSLMDPR